MRFRRPKSDAPSETHLPQGYEGAQEAMTLATESLDMLHSIQKVFESTGVDLSPLENHQETLKQKEQESAQMEVSEDEAFEEAVESAS